MWGCKQRNDFRVGMGSPGLRTEFEVSGVVFLFPVQMEYKSLLSSLIL